MKLRFYLSPSGANPVRKHLDSLNRDEAARVFAAIRYIEANGLDGSVVARQIRGKLWEIKVSSQRVFYVVINGPVMILLHAYSKQSQKAPTREIEIAERRMKEVT